MYKFFAKKISSFGKLSPGTSKNKGFTMIELLMVMSMLGALAAIVLLKYPGSQKKGRDTIRRSDIKQYQTAMEVYANKNSGAYFAANGNLTSYCGSTYLNLSVCPNDPKGSPAYGIRSTTTEYVLWAQLEMPNDTVSPPVVQFFVVCSNGKAGLKNTPAPSGSSCPI